MSYFSSTELSSIANPVRLVASPLSVLRGTTGLSTAPSANSQGGNRWYYSSTNLTTDVLVANFFADGKRLGMCPGDIIDVVQFSSAGSSVELFTGVITGVSTSGASLSTGASYTSTFA